MPDVTVIGAGPAGSVAAMLLARAGWRVDLIEQHRFPRDKVCGECLSAMGFEVLRRAGLADAFASLSPIRLSRSILHAGDGRSLSLDLREPMWGISRSRFDTFLLDAARQSGVIIHQPMRCESLLSPSLHTPPFPLTIHCRDLTTNQLLTLHPEKILLADGKSALLPSRPAATQDIGVKAHFTNLAAPRDAIQLFGVDGHYGGAAPIEDDRWNLAFSIPATRVKEFHGDFDALFARILSENHSLARQLNHATRIGDWLASPLPRFPVIPDWPPNIIPLGNAAAALEPIGGEGMGLAMRSAELVAESLQRNDPPTQLRRHFTHLWRPRRLATRLAAIVLSSEKLVGPCLNLADSAPQLGKLAMWMIGK